MARTDVKNRRIDELVQSLGRLKQAVEQGKLTDPRALLEQLTEVERGLLRLDMELESDSMQCDLRMPS